MCKNENAKTWQAIKLYKHSFKEYLESAYGFNIMEKLWIIMDFKSTILFNTF